MIGCIYMVVACLRNGLRERHLSDTPPANAVYSLVAAVAVTLIIGFPVDTGSVLFSRCFAGILCFALLQLCAALVHKRREHLDDPKDGE